MTFDKMEIDLYHISKNNSERDKGRSKQLGIKIIKVCDIIKQQSPYF
jgi:hypothetical protein